MASLISEALPKFTAETLRSAAKQSVRCHIVPIRLRRAIKNYLREQEDRHMRRKVLRLSESFNEIKDVNLQLTTSLAACFLFPPTTHLISKHTARADLGSGWGRIIYGPIRREKKVEMDVCRATNHDGSEGSFDHLVITQSKNPTLHHQARRSLWGGLWPF